jgi:hypothetical protein
VGLDVRLDTRNDGVGVLWVCFLAVEVCERTETSEPDGDFGRDTGELSGAGRRRLGAGAVESIADLSSPSSPMVDVEEVRDSDLDIGPLDGVSLESGLGPKLGVRRLCCVVGKSLILDIVECVLRATERIELPEETNGSLDDDDPCCFAKLRFNKPVLKEC